MVLSVVLMIFGFFSYDQMTVREYPDIDAPIVSVNTTWRGANASIVETQITQVLEDEIAGIGGVKRITSTSREARLPSRSNSTCNAISTLPPMMYVTGSAGQSTGFPKALTSLVSPRRNPTLDR